MKNCQWIRFLGLVLSVILVGSAGAQMSLVETSPADGAAGVALTATLSFTFNQAVDVTAEFPIMFGQDAFFLGYEIYPGVGESEDIDVSPDGLRVSIVNIDFEPDTKYVVILTGAQSAATGEMLDGPTVITFTTGAVLPEYTVSGTVTPTEGSAIDAVVKFQVMGGGGPVTRAAAVIDQADGSYAVPYVAEGQYVGLVVMDSDGNGILADYAGDAFGYYDPDADGVPGMFDVTEDLLGVDLTLHTNPGQTFGEAFLLVEAFATDKAADAEPWFVLTRQVQGFDAQTGESIQWKIHFFSASEDKTYRFFTMGPYLVPEGEEDMSGELVTTFDPDLLIDSDAAAAVAEATGGATFRENHDDAVLDNVMLLNTSAFPSAWRMVDGGDDEGESGNLGKLHTPVFFAGKSCRFDLSNQSRDGSGNALRKSAGIDGSDIWFMNYWSDSREQGASVLIDAETGEYIPPSTACEHLAAVDAEAANVAADAQLVFVRSENVNPDGLSIDWIYIYQSMTQGDLYEFWIMGEDVVRWPEDLTVEDHVIFLGMDDIPDVWVDSDAALGTVEANGGSEFRQTHEDWFIDVCLYTPEDGPAKWEIYYVSEGSGVQLAAEIDAVTGDLIYIDTDVEPEPRSGVPTSFELRQNYPNPFNPETVITYAVPRKEHVTLRILDILGREVAALVESEVAPGTYRIIWNGTNANGVRMSSGVYLCELGGATFRKVRRLLLIR